MRKALELVLCVGIALCSASCVATNDPESTGRLSLETRARQSGVAARESQGLRILGTRAAAKAPTPDRFAEQKGAGARATPIIPETPAGKSLTWLMAVFNGGTTRQLESAFAERFFRRTPEREVRSTLEQWRRDEFADGPADVERLVDSGMGGIEVILEGRTTGRYSRVRLSTDKLGKISALTLTSLRDYRPGEMAQWSGIDARLQELCPAASLAACEITDQGLREIHLFNADAPLAVGGLAGFAIAGTLAEQVSAGRVRWEESMPIIDEVKSLMGGRLQLETDESEFPLTQYLTLMLASSGWGGGWGDTTAFDHLLLRADRGQVENYMARFAGGQGRNRPFLATMEYFRIKLGADRTLPQRFAAANEEGRRALISTGGATDRSPPDLSVAANWRSPFEVERIGWFASAMEVSRMLADLVKKSEGPAMQPLARALRFNDATEDAGLSWNAAAVKSGSEPGVLSMAWILERHDGRKFTLILLANDPRKPLRNTELSEAAAAAVAILRDFEVRGSSSKQAER